MCQYLDRFASGEIKRLMIFAPPRHGKSELVSRRLPAFIMGQNPDAAIIASSYSATLAEQMNRDVQRIIDSSEYKRLFPETQLYGKNVRSTAEGAFLRNSETFEIVDHKGIYHNAGRGGPLTGFGGHYLFVDDPLKDRQEADSPTIRQNLWEWYASVLYSRQYKNAGICLTLTRWHEDALEGRLLSLAESDPSADQWVVLSLPAIAEEPLADYDQRQVGEALWEAEYPLEFLYKTRAQSAYEFAALYQQRPAPAEGILFKREWFEGEDKLVDAIPAKAKRIRYWDKAGTKGGDGACTAGVLLAAHEGMYYIEDIVRGRWDAAEREKIIKQTAEEDARKYGSKWAVHIWQEQEPGSGGKESAQNTVRNLAGFVIDTDKPVTNKDARLTPFASQCKAGNIRMKRAPWNFGFIEEACAIPYGKLRDQTDAAGGAFNKHAEPESKVSVTRHSGFNRKRTPRRSYPGWR